MNKNNLLKFLILLLIIPQILYSAVRYGGSVGDFTGADIDEVNDISVLA